MGDERRVDEVVAKINSGVTELDLESTHNISTLLSFLRPSNHRQ